MPKNYEIKFPVENYNQIKKKALSLRGKFQSQNHYSEAQKDFYYKVKKSRLKLRVINSSFGSLIFYDRPEEESKRISEYLLVRTKDHNELKKILDNLFEELVTISKKREIFIYDNIRIHLDKVKNLGVFLEFEIIFSSIDKAKKQMKEMIDHFGLDESKFINNSYSDLLIKETKKHK
jgi:predicted adenylyl cyclase CyaB